MVIQRFPEDVRVGCDTHLNKDGDGGSAIQVKCFKMDLNQEEGRRGGYVCDMEKGGGMSQWNVMR